MFRLERRENAADIVRTVGRGGGRDHRETRALSVGRLLVDDDYNR